MSDSLDKFYDHIAPLHKSYEVIDGVIKFQVIDLELDPFEVTITDLDNGDFEINTEGLTYLSLGLDTLEEIKTRIKKLQRKQKHGIL